MKTLIFILIAIVSLNTAFSQEKGSLVDKRDGQSYLTVTIGNQVWMAENLNYDTGKGNWYLNNDATNEPIYGKLYTWRQARKACPES